jgi:hypothetical protein
MEFRAPAQHVNATTPTLWGVAHATRKIHIPAGHGVVHGVVLPGSTSYVPPAQRVITPPMQYWPGRQRVAVERYRSSTDSGPL